MAAVHRVLISGGGIAGMSLAICLARTGVAVEIVEHDPEWRVYGAGITVTGPSLRAFARVGVLERIVAEGFCSDGAVFCDPTGKVTFAMPTERVFGPDIPNGGGILRPVLHKILSAATLAAGATVRLGVAVETVADDGSGVTAGFSDGTRGRYDLAVGADGVNSAMRRMIFPEAPAPVFTGQGCWRAMVPRPATINCAQLYLGGTVKAGVNPVSRDEMYLFALQHVPGNPRMAEDRLHTLLAEQLAEFGGAVGAVRDALSPDSRIIYRPLEKLLMPTPWYRGRVLLIGDAAHATTPHLASGAGIAVEDAVVLAEILSQDQTVKAALHAFMARRYERCRMVVENSVRIGELEMALAPMPAQMQVSRQTGEALRQPF